MSKKLYDKNSLKVDFKQEKESSISENTPTCSTASKKKPMSNQKAIMVVFMLFVMYVAISVIPTIVLMSFIGISFWISQLIIVISLAIVVWAFGLYKPASNEQKLKSKFLL